MMMKTLPVYSQTRQYVGLRQGLGWGLIGGLAGTLVMDLILMCAFAAAGLPTLTCFSIVGRTVGQFFTIPGITTTRAAALGMVTHYLVGPAVGTIFGVMMAWITARRGNTVKKSIGLAILYIELLSQPLLATTPILLKMTAVEILEWYAGSFVMHFILSIVLGAMVSYGLRPLITTRR